MNNSDRCLKELLEMMTNLDDKELKEFLPIGTVFLILTMRGNQGSEYVIEFLKAAIEDETTIVRSSGTVQ